MSDSPLNMDQFERFERAYQGELTEEEQQAFEAQLQSDASFREEYEQFVSSVAVAETHFFKDTVAATLQAQKSEKRNKKYMYAVLTAAALALLIFVFKPSSPSNEALFDQHFQRFPDLYQVRDTQQTNGLQEAMNAYNTEDYKKAIGLFSMVEHKNDTLHLYTAVSHLAGKAPLKAAEALEKIDNPLLLDQKQWYLALALLLQNEPDSAVVYLKKLENGSYGQKAHALLNQLQ